MKEQIINIFSEPKLQTQIAIAQKQYQLTLEEEISLKSILLTTFLITRQELSVYFYFDTIIDGIIKDRGKNNFEDIINKIIDTIFQNKENDFTLAKNLIYNFALDGYCFHSFNKVFLPTILEKGLIIKEKPWDNEAIEQIRKIFSNHNIKDVFGLYQGKDTTPIFFANSLKSSRFYAYSSPTWFRHFVSGGMKGNPNLYHKNAFFYRDYQSALENVIKLCESANVSYEEYQVILNFFNHYWGIIATNELPCVALIKRTELEKDQKMLPILEQETACDYTKRAFQYYGQGNHTVKNNIAKEKLIIFPYNLTDIKEMQPEKERSLWN